MSLEWIQGEEAIIAACRRLDGVAYAPWNDKACDARTLMMAALCYRHHAGILAIRRDERVLPPPEWPLDAKWWMPGDVLDNLVSAGALGELAVWRLHDKLMDATDHPNDGDPPRWMKLKQIIARYDRLIFEIRWALARVIASEKPFEGKWDA